MASELVRTFEDTEAERSATPAIIGVVGPNGTGKTRSMLRMATGMQRVNGGDIWMIDTEARRGLHYADKFKYRHVVFKAPFGPLDYLAAIEHCIKKGARHIIIDSASHEHEGPGGVLEMHDEEVERRAEAEAKRYGKKRTSWGDEKHNFPSWGPAKQERRALINYFMQQECNFFFGFRAKPKTKMVKLVEDGHKKTELVEQGWQAIAGDEFLFEMLVTFLLYPGAQGHPTFESDYPGERELIKKPDQFTPLYRKGLQLSEEVGQYIAEWCAGGDACAPFPPKHQAAVTGKPSANTQQQPKPQAKAQPKPPTQPAAKPESGAPASALRFHPKFREHGGQLIEGAEAVIRNEYDSWVTDYVSNLAGADRVKGDKHLEDFRELHLALTSEERLRAEESAA